MVNELAAIETERLSYYYREEWSGRRRQALSEVTFTVNAGESFGFLGRNGAGKTTTIKALLGLIRPKSGAVRLFGVSPNVPEGRRVVGYVSEQPYFYDHLSVSETVDFYACLAGVSREKRSAAVDTALNRLNLADRKKAKLRSLSKGLIQRIAIAQAIVAAPKLLVLDEPFSGLDPVGRREVRDLLTELKSAGTTIFMSSHILADVEFLCDRVGILAAGVLKGVFDLRNAPELQSDRYELVVKQPVSVAEKLRALCEHVHAERQSERYVFADRRAAEEGLRLALAAGVIVDSYEMQRGDLEDLFVRLVSPDFPPQGEKSGRPGRDGLGKSHV